MSPFLKIEVEIFLEIVAILHRWAEAVEGQVNQIGEGPLGPSWSNDDLTALYRAWLEVGNAIRDVAHTDPNAALSPRDEVMAIRDGLARIVEIMEGPIS